MLEYCLLGCYLTFQHGTVVPAMKSTKYQVASTFIIQKSVLLAVISDLKSQYN